MKDFQANRVEAPPNSILDVSMLETAQLDAQGQILGKASYRVTAIHSVTRLPNQIVLFEGNTGAGG